MNAPSTLPRRFEPKPKLPALESGDRMPSEEFMRRYEQRPDLKKVELIEGEVYEASPVRIDGHGTEQSYLVAWLAVYAGSTPGIRPGDNSTVKLDLDNVFQPDALLMIESGKGNQATIEGSYVVGAPELAAEIAASSRSIDLDKKLKVYRRNGVREYVVWRTEDAAIDWFTLRGSQFERQEPGPDGLHKSEVFPGLWLDPAALVRLDLPKVLAVLQEGLGSGEHGAFVERLREAANG